MQEDNGTGKSIQDNHRKAEEGNYASDLAQNERGLHRNVKETLEVTFGCWWMTS